MEHQQRIRPGSSSTASDFEDNIRPFKKAKYAWQIKGRGCYNKTSVFYGNKSCKNNCYAVAPPFSLQAPDKKVDSNFPKETIEFSPIQKHFQIDKLEIINLNNDLENLKNYDVLQSSETEPENYDCSKCNRNIGDSFPSNKDNNATEVIAKSEEITPDFSEMFHLSNPLDEMNSSSFSPAHMVAQCMDQFLCTLNHTNYTLRKWQTKQIAKGIIDNAINKVLEEMGFLPMPLESSDSELIISNPTGDISCQNIENEGVSEAIRQQGLQRRRCCGQIQSKEILMKEMPSSSVVLPIAELNLSEIKPFPQPNVPCTCKLHKINAHKLQHCNKVFVQNYNKQITSDFVFPQESSAQDDILNAAVSFAISEKGLEILTDSETS